MSKNKISLPTSIETNRTKLTQLKKEDAEHIQPVFKQKETLRWLQTPTLNKKQVEEVIKQKINNEKTLAYIATTRATKRRIGLIELTNIDIQNQKAMIGYILRKQYWGRGYATELVKKLTRHAFKHLHRLTAHVHAGNTESMNVLEKNAYKEEGILRDNIVLNNQRHDTYIYAALSTEWNQ